MSCLHEAADKEQFEVVKYLCGLRNKRLIGLKDQHGHTALDVAKSKGHGAMVKCLESASR